MTSVLYRKLSPKWAVPDDVYLFTEFTPIPTVYKVALHALHSEMF